MIIKCAERANPPRPTVGPAFGGAVAAEEPARPLELQRKQIESVQYTQQYNLYNLKL